MTTICLLSILLIHLTTVFAIPTISINGAKFFLSNGKQFFIKGVAYSESALNDPLADPTVCAADAALMKDLGVNSVTIYYVDTKLNHTDCMKRYADAGIYIWVSLVTPFSGINRANPTWTNEMFLAYADVMDIFALYDNTAGFWIANEVINDIDTTKVAPYVKAVARDLKAYASNQGYRNIPFGYSSSDVPATSPYLQNYFACGQNRSETIDFFGRNQYTWCGDSNMSNSTYDVVLKNTSTLNFPTFFSETGCMSGTGGRTWTDQTAILGPTMNDVFSGAIAYSWKETGNGYGLVSEIEGKLTPIEAHGYSYLKSQWATLTATGTPSAAYFPTLKPPSCPTSVAKAWLLKGDVVLPATAYTTLPVKTTSSSTTITSSSSASRFTLPSLTSSNVAGSTAVNANGSSPTSTSDGLSTGAKAGIGIGAALLGIIAAALGIFFFLRERRRHHYTTTETGFQKAELQGSAVVPEPPVEIYTDAPAAYTGGLHELPVAPRSQVAHMPNPGGAHMTNTAPAHGYMASASVPMGYDSGYSEAMRAGPNESGNNRI